MMVFQACFCRKLMGFLRKSRWLRVQMWAFALFIFILKLHWNVMFSSLFVKSFIGTSPSIHPIFLEFQNTTWSLRLLRCRWLTLASKLVQRHLNGQKPYISFRWSRNPTSSTWILWCVHVAKVKPGYRRGEFWMFDSLRWSCFLTDGFFWVLWKDQSCTWKMFEAG